MGQVRECGMMSIVTFSADGISLLFFCCWIGDDSVGYFIQPTVILTKNPKSITMVEEVFGPVLTVYVYEDDKFEDTCRLIDTTTQYALTGSM